MGVDPPPCMTGLSLADALVFFSLSGYMQIGATAAPIGVKFCIVVGLHIGPRQVFSAFRGGAARKSPNPKVDNPRMAGIVFANALVCTEFYVAARKA